MIQKRETQPGGTSTSGKKKEKSADGEEAERCMAGDEAAWGVNAIVNICCPTLVLYPMTMALTHKDRDNGLWKIARKRCCTSAAAWLSSKL